MKIIIGAFLFMAFFTSLMANSKELHMHERVVQLPGAELRFSMAEDFSKDMPAAPLVDVVTIDMLKLLKKPGDRFVIGRRWWDLKPPGWFKKSWGSMQMTLLVGKMTDVMKRKNACAVDQADFLVYYHDSLVDKFSEHNSKISEADFLEYGVYVSDLFGATGQEYYPRYRYKKSASNLVILHTAAAQHANIYSYYSFPVNSDFFVEFEFIGAPDLNGSPYLFQNMVRERIDAALEKISVFYSADKKCAASPVGNWVETDSVKLLKPDPSVLPKPIPVEEFLKANGLKELPGTRELLGE